MFNFKTVIISSLLIMTNSYASSCGPHGDKVRVCHNKKNKNNKSICIPFNAIWAHFDGSGRGHEEDHLGYCEDEISATDHAWMCNAGLRHKPHGTESENCEGDSCISLNDSGHLADSIQFKTANYLGKGVVGDFSSTFESLRAGSANYNKITSNAGSQVIKDLSFHLNSERIGSEYFVDYCWENKDNNTQDVELDVSSSISSAHDGIPYIEMVDLKTDSEVICSYDFDLGFLNVEPNLSYLTSTVGPLNMFREKLDYRATNCIVRQYFKESRIRGRDQRHNKFKEITVSTSISTNVEDTGMDADGTVNVCIIIAIPNGGKKVKDYSCIDDNMDTDEFRAFVAANGGKQGIHEQGLCSDIRSKKIHCAITGNR